MSYRRDIDGLRAIAVLSVIAYHLGISYFQGGFVGVDVFFVISGYVIFKGTLPSIEEGSFSFKDFFKRRLYRIQPALLVLLAATFIPALFILTPSELTNFSKSALSAALNLSNFHFNDLSGNYFAPLSESSPLLHTWSLGVEGQFYLIAPLMLLIASRKKSIELISKILFFTLVGSFILNVSSIYLSGDQGDAFYLPTHRFWEFSVGALIAILERKSYFTWRERYSSMSYIGMAGILFSTICVENNGFFPGFFALIPVLSTTLIIAFNHENSYLSKVLLSKPLVFVGKISFSLYLTHWPIIVFYELHSGSEITTPVEQALIFSLSFVSAIVLFKFVELPARKLGKSKETRTLLHFAVPLSLVFMAFIVIKQTKGLPERLNEEALAIYSDTVNVSSHPCPAIEGWSQRKASVCGEILNKSQFDFLVWGDSHAGMLGSTLRPQLAAMDQSVVFATMADCPPLIGVYTSKRKNREECAELAQGILERIEQGIIRNIVLVSRWATLASPVPAPSDGQSSKEIFSRATGEKTSFDQALKYTVSILKEKGAQVIVVGPVPEVDFDVPETMIRSIYNGFSLPVSKRSDFDIRQRDVLDTISSIERENMAKVVLPHTILCDQHSCTTHFGKRPLYSDDDHLNEYGSSIITPLIIKASIDYL